MNLRPKVDRTYYRRLPQSQFSDFLQDIVAHCDGNEKFEALAPTIATLKDKANVFTDALIACQQGGKDRVLVKDLAKQEVVHAINNFSDGMNFYADGNIAFFASSNLPLQHAPEKHTAELVPPSNIAGEPTKVSGQVIITFEVPALQKNAVNNIGVEWSIDEGATWNNGKYPSSKYRMVLNGLPSLQRVMIRLRCLGTRDRVSNWSNPIAVNVV